MKRVLLLLADGFEAYEAAAFTDVLGFASTYGDEEIEVVTVGIHPVLNCTFGFKVVPGLQLRDARDDDFDASRCRGVSRLQGSTTTPTRMIFLMSSFVSPPQASRLPPCVSELSP